VLHLTVSYSNGIVEYLSSKKPISITYRGSGRLRNAYPSRIGVVEARKYKDMDVSIRVYRYIGIRDREYR
jgi:hypothetical protein